MDNTQTLELQIKTTAEGAVKSVKLLNSSLKETKNATDKVSNSISKMGKALSTGGLYLGVKRVTNQFLKWMDLAVDRTEQLNLFNVVFKNMEKNGTKTFSTLGREATKFQNKLNEAFGTNLTETTKYQGLFQSMGENVGIPDTYSAIMSTTMTKLTYDLASLYNKQESVVAEALRAGVYAGQTKPLRSYGIDVTQTSMQPILNSLGITDRSIKQMSQAEKEILRYLATLKQAKVAMGDFANTIESPANQMKVFKQQLVEAKVALSSLFIGTFSQILPYANAFLMVVKEVAKSLADIFGIKLSDYNTGIASSEDAYAGLSDSIDDATDSVKELKRQTLGFDQINNISENKNSDSGNLTGGIDKRLLEAITGYDNGMESVRMKATEIRDRIMEWLGFTKETNEETGEISYKLSEGYSNLKLIAGIIGSSLLVSSISKIAKLIGSSGLLKSITSIVKVLQGGKIASLGTTLVSFATGPVGIAIGVITALAGVFIHAYNTSDTFKQKVDEMVSSVSILFQDLYNVFSATFKQIWEVVEPIWNILKETVIVGIKNVYDNIVFVLSNIVDTITGTCKIISDLLHGDFKQAWKDATDMVGNLRENWQKHFEKIKENFAGFKDKIIDDVINFKDKAIEKLEGLATWIKELPNKFFYYAGQAVGFLWKVITETNWIELGKKVLNGIVSGIKNIGNSVWNFGTELFKKLIDAIKNINWKQIGQQVLNGIKDGLFNIGNTIKGWGEAFVDGLKKALGIHSPSRLVIDAKIGNYTTDGILVGMKKQIPKLQETANDMISGIERTFANANLETPFSYSVPNNMPNINSECSVIRKIVVESMAQTMSQYGGQSSSIDVHVHTDEGTVVDRINQTTKQTGVCPINIPVY